jgi:hypothetical protein
MAKGSGGGAKCRNHYFVRDKTTGIWKCLWCPATR